MLASKIAETKANLALMAAKAAPYATLPATMYYTPNQTTVVWLNSFYTASPAAPTGSASVAWVNAATINSTLLAYYAVAFTPNKSELLPLPQTVIDANPKLGGQWYGY